MQEFGVPAGDVFHDLQTAVLMREDGAGGIMTAARAGIRAVETAMGHAGGLDSCPVRTARMEADACRRSMEDQELARPNSLWQPCVIAILLVASTVRPVDAALNLTEQSIPALSQAYGYVLGQQESLARVEAAFPELGTAVAQARQRFDAAFAGIGGRLDAELVRALGADKVAEARKAMLLRLVHTPSAPWSERGEARRFIERVQARARGEIEQPVLEMLLAVKYDGRPEAEFYEGHRQEYRTDGSGKSRGVALRMQVPRSWKARDSQLPNTVQSFVSEGGFGRELVTLQVRESTISPDSAQVERWMRSGEARQMAPAGSRVDTVGTFSLQGRPGLRHDYLFESERNGSTVRLRVRQYTAYLPGRTVLVACSSLGPESDAARVDAAFDLIRPLCERIVGSVELR